MATGASCPISGEMIDESSARVNGGITLTLLAIGTLTPYHWILLYLAADFAIKVFAGFAYSPNCWIAGRVARALHFEPNMVDAAPKRFASIIALCMTLGALVSVYGFGAYAFFYAFAATFALFAFLECVLGFCMGCTIYGLLPRRMSVAFVRKGR
jgi:hypothetical protein